MKARAATVLLTRLTLPGPEGPGILTAVQAHPQDSTVDRTLLGDRVTPIIQFIFQQAPWVMWGGVVLGLVLLAVILRWAWPRRGAALSWVRTRSRGLKLAMVSGLGLVVLLAAGLGWKSYEFVETDRRFCNGCHIFIGTGQAWIKPDTGDYTLVPLLEGKHDSINCHTCHPLKPLKEGVKLVLWMSGIRDSTIPEHAKVPRQVCERCHVQGAAKETWQAIAATAGHRTHLESDSSALKGKVQCLTCHARTAHRFEPADTTCVQQGCHLTGETDIRLGRMADQTDLHCIVCHQFTAAVPALATRDSAAGTLRPAEPQCLSCHQMQERLGAFSRVDDPHNGTCGMCHNPHRQTRAAQTKTSCTTAGCHADWRKVPFHTGAQHRARATDCTLCHEPHHARVDASDCTGCHTSVRTRGTARPPLPFDTTKALPQSLSPAAPAPPPSPEPRPSKVKGDAPPWDGPPGESAVLSPLPSDTFSHTRHQKLPCLTCHVTSSGQKLTFEPPRGCQICHHQRPAESRCAQCHQPDVFAGGLPVPVTVQVPDRRPRTRSIAFDHTRHADLDCQACHGMPVTLAPVDSALTCRGCHADHHAPGRDCAACHRTPAIRTAHAAPVQAHARCDACHTPARIAGLLPDRAFCLACHDPTVDHYGPAACSTCHLQAHPEAYRVKLAGGAGS